MALTRVKGRAEDCGTLRVEPNPVRDLYSLGQRRFLISAFTRGAGLGWSFKWDSQHGLMAGLQPADRRNGAERKP